MASVVCRQRREGITDKEGDERRRESIGEKIREGGNGKRGEEVMEGEEME